MITLPSIRSFTFNFTLASCDHDQNMINAMSDHDLP